MDYVRRPYSKPDPVSWENGGFEEFISSLDLKTVVLPFSIVYYAFFSRKGDEVGDFKNQKADVFEDFFLLACFVFSFIFC